jgi:hypothetical protein
MSSSQKRIVDCASVGVSTPKILTNEETVKFIIYDFEGRNEKRGECIKSPILKAHGYKWRITVYPRGNTSNTERPYPSLLSCY